MTTSVAGEAVQKSLIFLSPIYSCRAVARVRDGSGSGYWPEEGSPGFSEDGIAQADIQTVQLCCGQPAPIPAEMIEQWMFRCQPEDGMHWFLEISLQHGERPRNDYASDTSAVNRKATFFRKGFIFSSFGQTG